MSFLGHEWDGRIFSDGWNTGSGGTRTTVAPATGEVLATVGVATADDVAKATDSALRAQRDWAASPFGERAAILRRAAQLFVEHADEINEWLMRESGATAGFATFQVAAGAAEECWEAAALASASYGEMLRTNQDRLSFSRQVPVGVVGVIAPFNAPVLLAVRALAPALALGNAVILKPDPRTSVCGGVAFARIFEEAGLPTGLLHVLPGDAAAGAAIVDHPRIPVIAFTGSTRAGRAIARAAADRLKRVHLELGGNSALIVTDDVDLDKAVSVGAFGSYNNAGQICMASSRHLVDARIADDYTRLMAEHAARLTVGDTMDPATMVGPIIDTHQRDAVHAIVTNSVAAGATLAEGGTYDGLFYRPTVLGNVPLTAPAYHQEIFGPVVPIVPFHSLDEAADLAAETEYGLSLAILTRDVTKALRLADRIPSGAVHINDQTVNDEPNTPFGGVGDSGNGSRHGGTRANLEAFTETQWVTVRGELPDYPF